MGEGELVMKIDLKEIKIALVTLQQDAERVPPTGLIYLATYLNERVGLKKENIRIFDKNFTKNMEKDVLDFSADIIGISSMTIDYGKVIKFAKKIKPRTRAKLILGGVHISTLPESLDSSFDAGVIGEGEETFKEVVETYAKSGKLHALNLKKIKSTIFLNRGKLVTTPKRSPIELDSLPIPNFKFVNKEYFRKEEILSTKRIGTPGYIITSRGCPYQCVFCSTAMFWGKMRFHSPEFIAKIVKRLHDDFGCDYLEVFDDLFAVSPKRIREIREAFEKEGVMSKINGIICNLRTNLMTDELCIEMKKIKITTVNFGFESGSHKMLTWLKQHSVSPQANVNAIKLCVKYGFKIYGSLIYGSPTETIEDMKETNRFIDFARKNGVTFLWSFVATPFPATQFWDIALERGKVSPHMDWDTLGLHGLDDPLLLDPEIDRKEFRKVFLEGSKKLNKMKMKMIREFISKNFLLTSKLVLGDPKYYLTRMYKQFLMR